MLFLISEMQVNHCNNQKFSIQFSWQQGGVVVVIVL